MEQTASLFLNTLLISHMERWRFFLAVVFGVFTGSLEQISGSVLEKTIRPGDNITLYCDCKTSTGVYIVWYRNCSHENQPSLSLGTRFTFYPEMYSRGSALEKLQNPLPHYHLLKNGSSKSYDLLITNITESEEGLYYCGTEQTEVEEKQKITQGHVYTYGNVTRVKLNSTAQVSGHHEACVGCDLCWILLLSLCPAFAVFSSLLSFLLTYCLFLKKAKHQDDEVIQTDGNGQDEDVCYAALEIPKPSQRPKRKKTQSCDFSTYSAINTSRM
ncbi:uncharacterized protein LOC121509075 [Cheilinus undulatus]|uniref:uncharacterized protein LOC121509075 n=1 Tax=Cheilinus undulatus TaxID=241271 RepID=UPI001BD42316|nr:uncharacterized protein LOC121509075 [Cheilinus undulatus]